MRLLAGENVLMHTDAGVDSTRWCRGGEGTDNHVTSV